MKESYGVPLPGLNLDDLVGKLIVIEGTDGVGRSTQIRLLKEWLEQQGHAVLDTGLTRSGLVGKGIKRAKEGHTLGRITLSFFMPPISPTGWKTRSCRRCARDSWCSPTATSIR